MANKPLKYTSQTINEYQGKQVLINSDRLVFNAKTDSILLYSNNVIGFSTNGSFHFDTDNRDENSNFIINSPNIYLGLEFDNSLPTEPAVLGNELEKILEAIIDLIKKVYFDMHANYSYSYGSNNFTGMNPKNGEFMFKKHREIDKNIVPLLQNMKSKNTKLV